MMRGPRYSRRRTWPLHPTRQDYVIRCAGQDGTVRPSSSIVTTAPVAVLVVVKVAVVFFRLSNSGAS